jgi:hypothetical protein
MKSFPLTIFICTAILSVVQPACRKNPVLSDQGYPLILVRPSGAAALYYGDTVNIVWKANAGAGHFVKIRISTDNLRHVWNLDSVGAPSADSCAWIIGQENDRSKLTYPSDSVRIIISDSSGAIADTSDGILRVRPLKLTRPLGGETVYIGDTVMVTWQNQPKYFSSFKVMISSDNCAHVKLLSNKSFTPLDSCRWIVGMENERLGLTYPSDSVRIVICDYDYEITDTTKQCIKVLNR